MAEIRYVARCPRCKTGHAEDIASDGYASEFLYLTSVRGGGHQAHRSCRSCGCGLYVWRRVSGRYSDARKCDARCTGATGPDCECQCGGHNHGADNL
jgi:hypothetical protein